MLLLVVVVIYNYQKLIEVIIVHGNSYILNAAVTDINKLKHAKYFSLLLDESNDISNVKNLLIYCQFLNTEKSRDKFH